MQHWFRFNAVGALGIVVQLAVLALLVHVVRVPYLPATLLAVEAAVLHNFAWHERWTWASRDARGSPLTRLAAFNVSNGLVSLAGNLVLMRVLVGGWNLPPLVANLAAIAVCATVNFVVSDRIVFRGAEIQRADLSRSRRNARTTHHEGTSCVYRREEGWVPGMTGDPGGWRLHFEDRRSLR